ncbi:hypothetical protein FRC96_16635 [Lujinxingia vulgaris]|uniref:Uncharacterized protein n=1 Tax=Lujinxingia vulgaris TaxID=2600176 RepID=A0A5C6X2W2_9DELT|nr:hypothetical protein [Lujinxingia vulgaris]TXD32712.1 hypothetical protein FRC96_16635 [Lujinxingia vulgaris]
MTRYNFLLMTTALTLTLNTLPSCGPSDAELCESQAVYLMSENALALGTYYQETELNPSNESTLQAHLKTNVSMQLFTGYGTHENARTLLAYLYYTVDGKVYVETYKIPESVQLHPNEIP